MIKGSKVLIALALGVGAFSAGMIYAQQSRPLDPPPMANSNAQAIEVLRVWAAPGSPQQLTLRPIWKDPAAWGLVMVDIARHATRAYTSDPQEQKRVLARIRAGFDAEWAHATDDPQTIKPQR